MKLPRLFGPRSAAPEPMPKIEPRAPVVSAVKASAAGPAIATMHVGRPVWSTRDYLSFAHEAYKLNAVSFRCTRLIASNAAAVPLCLYKGKNEVEEHPLLDLIARPNPMFAGQSFFEAVYSFLMLAGNSYLEAVGPDGKPPRELWFLRPDRMMVVAGPFGVPAGYEHRVDGRITKWQADPVTGHGPILHVRDFNPTDDWYGLSRVEAAAFAVDRHNAASEHNKALLDNGARPSGALVFKPMQGLDGPMPAPQEMLDKASARLTERHAGAANAARPMVFSGDVSWEEMGLSPRDMDFAQGKDDAAWDICLAMGVPPVLIVKGQLSYNNIKEAKLELYEETVLPAVDQVVDGLNAWLAPLYGDRLMFKPDLDRVSALELRREVKRKTALELFDKGVIEDEEAREMLDYGPRKPGFVRKVDGSTITALLGAVQTVGLTPLVRYMKSVGLFDEGATEEEILAAAMTLAEDAQAEEELATPNQEQTPPEDDTSAEGDAIDDAQED